MTTTARTIQTRIPARLDRLPWSWFHWRVLLGLGTVWVLDGLEVTVVSSVASRLTEHGSGIALSAGDVGVAAALYVTGACLGALFFGQLTWPLGTVARYARRIPVPLWIVFAFVLLRWLRRRGG